MHYLQKFLTDVLAGARIVNDRATFDYLRQIASDKTEQLNRLEGEAIARRTERTFTPVERIYRESGTAARPHPSETTNAKKITQAEVHLQREDAEEILQHRRPATVEEIEWLLQHANDYRLQLTKIEELALRNIAARLLADQHVARVRSQHQNDEFLAKVVGTYRTPYGDLSQAEVTQLETIRVRATHAIQVCDDHERERCKCWREARDELFELRTCYGQSSAMGMASLAVWNSIEDLARNRRLEPQMATEQPEPLLGIAYNWRYYKCPDYVRSRLQGEQHA